MKAIKDNLGRVVGIACLLLVFGWVFSFFREGSQESFAEFCLYLTYTLLGVLLTGSLALAVGHLLLNKRALKKTVIIYGVSTAIFLISWVSSSDDLSTVKPSVSYTSSSLQFVGGLVGFVWGLLVIIVLSVLASEVFKAVKNG